MTPAIPKETAEQRQQRIRAENDNIRAVQNQAQARTLMFRRLQSPRLSIATGRTVSALPLVG